MAQLSLSEKCVLFAKLSLLVFLVLATLVESEEWRRRATDGERERGNSSRSASLDEVIHALGTLVTKSQVSVYAICDENREWSITATFIVKIELRIGEIPG